jgi:hypothetical protein
MMMQEKLGSIMRSVEALSSRVAKLEAIRDNTEQIELTTSGILAAAATVPGGGK